MKLPRFRSKGYEKTVKITLAGAPNVGKSTVFNALTGLRQHTGNWAGKTVETARGHFITDGVKYDITDIPGTYSLFARSAEEEVARRYIEGHPDDVTVVVCDASGLLRSLPLALQILSAAKRCVVFLNLCDEAKKAGISVDAERLSELLGVPVVRGAARRHHGINELVAACRAASETERGIDAPVGAREAIARADVICREVVTKKKESALPSRADRILAGRASYAVMALLLVFIFWLTLKGANYPSELIARGATYLSALLRSGLSSLGAPEYITSFLVDGVYGTSAWIVSVMLPPMAIFFPLFTLLEDAGYLPRVAFCLDRVCRGCGGCGKMALCMCEGLGCNAVGVTGSRIIDSRRERLLAALTNSFIPCNGRFPALIALITVFIVPSGSALAASSVLAFLVILSVAASLCASKLLSATLLRGVPSSFALELPRYRLPKFGEVIVRSVFDRTLFVLGRAIAVAAPAGGVIWILANVKIGGAALLAHISGALDPVGHFLGMDGAILLAFLLGLPANEIILPLIVMIYLSSGTLPAIGDLSALRDVFVSHGWTLTTAICTTLFFLFHSPCTTTLLTLKKETGSVKYTLIAAALPVALGAALCAAVNFFMTVFSA